MVVEFWHGEPFQDGDHTDRSGGQWPTANTQGAYPATVQAGVIGDGYISGPSIRAQFSHSPPDLLLTMDAGQGNVIFSQDQSDMDSGSNNSSGVE